MIESLWEETRVQRRAAWCKCRSWRTITAADVGGWCTVSPLVCRKWDDLFLRQHPYTWWRSYCPTMARYFLRIVPETRKHTSINNLHYVPIYMSEVTKNGTTACVIVNCIWFCTHCTLNKSWFHCCRTNGWNDRRISLKTWDQSFFPLRE